ncbi:MAG: substrate-binding domain-containing protein, partial [Spirochaetia bacterium]
GLETALETAGNPAPMEFYVDFGDHIGTSLEDIIEHTYEETKKILAAHDIDGIFFVSDEMAYGGLRAVKEQNKDIAVIGYDDLPMTQFYGLTTIRQPVKEMGVKGAQVLLQWLADERNTSPLQIKLPTELIIRET